MDRKTLYRSLPNPQQTYKLGHYRRTATSMVRVFSEDAGRALEKGERSFGRVVDRWSEAVGRAEIGYLCVLFWIWYIYRKLIGYYQSFIMKLIRKSLPVSGTVYLPHWSVLFLLELAVAYRFTRWNLDHKPNWLIDYYLFIEAVYGPFLHLTSL